MAEKKPVKTCKKSHFSPCSLLVITVCLLPKTTRTGARRVSAFFFFSFVRPFVMVGNKSVPIRQAYHLIWCNNKHHSRRKQLRIKLRYINFSVLAVDIEIQTDALQKMSKIQIILTKIRDIRYKYIHLNKVYRTKRKDFDIFKHRYNCTALIKRVSLTSAITS